ncbi:MAG TPA: hypothetical protein VFQ82_01205 [Stellaceae bacterium]|jgi:hypothetical protein|nr:hypothetical protein [Stellaceae bacterium]
MSPSVEAGRVEQLGGYEIGQIPNNPRKQFRDNCLQQDWQKLKAIFQATTTDPSANLSICRIASSRTQRSYKKSGFAMAEARALAVRDASVTFSRCIRDKSRRLIPRKLQ